MWFTISALNHRLPLSGNKELFTYGYCMIKKNEYRLVIALIFMSVMAIAQTKSTNLQTFEGKKYYIHKIEKSQSLYAISKLYSVSLDELYQTNPELKNGAKVNQEIKVPAYNIASSQTITPSKTSTAIDTTKFLVHKVQKSETVYSIARKYGSNEKTLALLNPNLTEGIKEGQLLIVAEKNKKKQNNLSAAPKEPKESKENKVSAMVKEIKPNTPLVDSSLFKPVSKPVKTNYNVALILPLRLDATIDLDLNELVKNNGNFPAVPGLAIDFYLGFKRAMDSLIAKDYEINLELFDIDDKDSLKIVALTSSPKFAEFDFIFGPFYANGFKIISKKAKELRIPIVSPITQQNKILYNNIYISKTNPSQFTLLENLVDYCVDSLKNANSNIILMQLSDKDKKEVQFVNAFKKHYNEKVKPGKKSPKDSLIIAKGISGLKSVISSSAKNIIVTLSSNQVFAIDFITQLSLLSEKKDIVLCGWETLRSMDNIDQEYLNSLNFTFPHQFNLTNTAAYTVVNDYYKMQQETLPGEYFYIGFDIAYYYLKNLKEKGPDFVNTLNTLPLETNYMNFKFTRPDNSTGFDNRGVYIFKYNNYQLQKTGWK